MEGKIDKIWENETKDSKKYHVLNIDGENYSVWDPKLLEGLSEGSRVEYDWKKKLAEEYRSKGWRVVEEYPIGGGKSVDLACFKEGRKVAVEIETGKSYAAYNLKKCMEAGFDEVRIIKI